MNILGISWGTCSTAALLVNGEVVACTSEERFSRIKNDDRYPKQAIEAVLTLGSMNPSRLDLVVFGGQRFDAKAVLTHKYSGYTVEDRLREEREYWYPKLYEKRDVSYLDVFKDKIDTEQFGGEWERVVAFLKGGNLNHERDFFEEFRCEVVRRHLGVSRDKVHFVNHHRAHACYAYYGSPLRGDKVLVLTADGFGDDENATVSVCKGGSLEFVSRSDNFQVARLYRSMTLLLGMKPDEHEYKLMGLAGYAKPEYYGQAYHVFKSTQFVEGLGFAYRRKPPDLYVYFRELLEGCRFDAIAGALQTYTEEILCQWTRNAVLQSKADRVVFGGGIAMNVKAMMRLANLPEVADLFICPSPSDESLAIGAAYVAMHDHLCQKTENPETILKPLPDAYLGAAASAAEVERTVRGFEGDPAYRIHRGVNSRFLAEALANGKIAGRCIGRSEFGARGLGNRSILADPRSPGTVRKINESVKSRDFWMPFAPTIMLERSDDYLSDRKGMLAPYMTIAFETSSLAREEMVAGLHAGDLTCRPQILDRRHNREYYELLAQFEDITGVGGVLNTSFNLHGEPIVQTPSDAERVFRKSSLDLVALDGFVIEKVGRKQVQSDSVQ